MVHKASKVWTHVFTGHTKNKRRNYVREFSPMSAFERGEIAKTHSATAKQFFDVGRTFQDRDFLDEVGGIR
jgi:hypothetical protein